MLHIEDPAGMVRLVDDILASEGNGMLVSGGCDPSGRVPVLRMEDPIRYASGKGLKVNVHAGFLNERDAECLVAAGVTAFSADIHQDPMVIRNVLNLDVSPSAYADSVDNILKAGGTPAVHLTAGFGTADLSLSADLVRNKGLKDVILLALVPTKGTITEDTLISEDAIVDSARMLIGMGFGVTLGCMRPRVHRNLEIRCILEGVRRIANPSRGTISWAKENGFTVVERRMCCCIR
jgi:uncharacterized radical SAM superfamily protein